MARRKDMPTAERGWSRPNGILAGFHAEPVDPAVPELVHLGEQWITSTYHITRHQHAVWELYLQLDGTSVWRSVGQEFLLKPGDLFLAPPRIEHEIAPRRGDRHHFLFAAIDLTVVLRRLPALADDRWRARACLHRPGASGVDGPFRQLIAEATAARAFRAEGLRVATDLLLIAVARAVAGDADRRLVAEHPGIARARDAMESAPAQPWTLAELARLAALAPTHFAARFAAEVGEPPHRFLLAVRVRRAKTLLRDTDQPITRLGLDLGFASSQHFARVFRAATGVTAREWRGRT